MFQRIRSLTLLFLGHDEVEDGEEHMVEQSSSPHGGQEGERKRERERERERKKERE
jgi:hypothetical protein